MGKEDAASCLFPSYKRKDGDWTTSQGRIKELEVLFHRSEAELTATLTEKRSLEAEVADLLSRLAKVNGLCVLQFQT